MDFAKSSVHGLSEQRCAAVGRCGRSVMWWNTTTTSTTVQVTTADVDAGGPTAWPALARRDEALVTAEIGVQMTIFLLAVGGNALVLGMLVALSRRKELGRMYTMIGHLSCADLLVAIFNLLPQV